MERALANFAIIALIILPVWVFADPRGDAPITVGGLSWSPIHSKMTWADAQRNCNSLKMRLPTKAELYSGVKNGVWFDRGPVYWSSTEVGDPPEMVYALLIQFGQPLVAGQTRTTQVFSRCVR